MLKLLILCIIISLSSCGIKLGRNDRVKRPLPSIVMQDFLYAFTEKTGYRQWEVKAAHATIFEEKNEILLYNMTMTIFSESNEIKSVLIANQGLVFQDIGNIEAEGEVQILSSNQSQLLAEKVYWDQQRNLFWSETNTLVTYLRPSQKIIGYNMIADSDLENVEIDNSVGQIQLQETNKNTNNNELINTE